MRLCLFVRNFACVCVCHFGVFGIGAWIVIMSKFLDFCVLFLLPVLRSFSLPHAVHWCGIVAIPFLASVCVCVPIPLIKASSLPLHNLAITLSVNPPPNETSYHHAPYFPFLFLSSFIRNALCARCSPMAALAVASSSFHVVPARRLLASRPPAQSGSPSW